MEAVFTWSQTDAVPTPLNAGVYRQTQKIMLCPTALLNRKMAPRRSSGSWAHPRPGPAEGALPWPWVTSGLIYHRPLFSFLFLNH